MRILRIIRGIATTALTWAAVWVPVSFVAIGVASVFRTGPALGMSVTRFAIVQATLGAITGAVFATSLAIAGGRRTLGTLKMPLMAVCGAGVATFVPVLVRIGLVGGLDVPMTAIVSTFLTSGLVGATCATLTLAIARRAPALPDHNDSSRPALGIRTG
jgi:hypothetical protein